jgi:hypothetical protein
VCTWRVLAASVPGTSHIRQGKGCDDAHGHIVLDNPTTLIAAVADGAGSASLGGVGARVAVEEVVRWLGERLVTDVPQNEPAWHDALSGAFAAARQALELRVNAVMRDEPSAYEQDHEVAAGHNPSSVQLRDLATTLLVGVAADGWLAWAHVGDGALVAFDEGDSPVTVSWPSHGPYLDETVFLTSAHYADETGIGVVETSNIAALALLTDGIELIALDFRAEEPYLPFFEAMLRYVRGNDSSTEDLAAFLASDAVSERTDDDRTLLLAVAR